MKRDKITRRKFVAGTTGAAMGAMIVPRHVRRVMTTFIRFQLSIYRTDDSKKAERLLEAAKIQTRRWLDGQEPSQEQRNQTQIFSGRSESKRNENAKFVVLSLIPLKEGDASPIVWDPPLSNAFPEDITLKLEQSGFK